MKINGSFGLLHDQNGSDFLPKEKGILKLVHSSLSDTSVLVVENRRIMENQGKIKVS